MNISEDIIIGQLVAEDYRTAAVFHTYGIDFCCQGNRTLKDACTKKNIDTQNIVNDLNSVVNQQSGNSHDYQSWHLDLLADYIEKKHHRYVVEKTPIIKQYLEKICEVHGVHHPELFEIKQEFFASAIELANHMNKEETILFPYIRRLISLKLTNSESPEMFTEFVQFPIEVLMQEHEVEGNRFRKISELSNNYTMPADGCNTFKVTFAMLKEFEEDLHLHIHLENNILFPNTIELEAKLNQKAA
jgi:regulator of cell morphogenesis and NO signaling